MRNGGLMTKGLVTERGKVFGPWLVARMNAYPMKASELATRAGVSNSMVSFWRRGLRVPDNKSCYAIADALDLDPYTVLEAAGRLEERSDDPGDEVEREIAVIVHALSEQERQVVLEFVRFRREMARRRGAS